jgi:hypothetical protein
MLPGEEKGPEEEERITAENKRPEQAPIRGSAALATHSISSR